MGGRRVRVATADRGDIVMDFFFHFCIFLNTLLICTSGWFFVPYMENFICFIITNLHPCVNRCLLFSYRIYSMCIFAFDYNFALYSSSPYLFSFDLYVCLLRNPRLVF